MRREEPTTRGVDDKTESSMSKPRGSLPLQAVIAIVATICALALLSTYMVDGFERVLDVLAAVALGYVLGRDARTS